MSDPFEESVLDVLFTKMYDRNIDQDVIGALRAHQGSICVDYRMDDPNDITIVNNKIERIAELAAHAESPDCDVDDQLVNSMLRVLRTKY